MNDSNQIRDAFAHYRYRRASQLLEGDSDAHWVIAYQHADELIDFDSFEAAWVLQESAITAQREALARAEAERAELWRQHREAAGELVLVQAVRAQMQEDRDTAQAQLAEMRRIVAGFLFNYDDGVGKPWERRLLDYARKLVAAKEFNAQAEQQEAGEMLPRVKHLLPMPAVKPPKPEAQGAQAGEFQREDRYIVIKRKDLERLPVGMRGSFSMVLNYIAPNLPKREYLVVESDWPEYEPTWAAIQARLTGQGAQAGDDQDQVHQLAFEVGEPDEDGDGYHFSAEQLDEFVAKLNGAALATQPAAGEPIQVEAVAITREDEDGLYLDWVLEGGISALEAPGVVLLVAHGEVTDRHGSGEVYLAPPAAAHGDEAVRKEAVAAYVDMSCNSVLIDGATCYYLPSERMAAFDRMFSLGDAMRAQGDGSQA